MWLPSQAAALQKPSAFKERLASGKKAADCGATPILRGANDAQSGASKLAALGMARKVLQIGIR